MSWNGTVRCSHCYTTGHNRRSCPSITKQVLKDYKGYTKCAQECRDAGDEVGASSYDTYVQRERETYIKRSGLNPDTGSRVKNKVARGARLVSMTCGYCKKRGHTRRTCQPLKQDFAVFKHLTRKVRAEKLVDIRALGCTVGSLIPVEARGWRTNAAGEENYEKFMQLNFVTKVDWSRLQAHLPHADIFITCDMKQLHKAGDGYYQRNMSVETVERCRKENPTQISLSDCSSINAPDGWLEGTDLSIREAFPVKQDRPWDYGSYGRSEEIKEARIKLGLAEADNS